MLDFVQKVLEGYIIFLFFAGLLLFSLFRSGAKSRKKARSVLIIILASAVIWVVYYLISIRKLPEMMAIMVPGILLVLGIIFHRVVFPYKGHCVNCGKALSITEFLSMDDHLCAACYEKLHPETRKLTREEQFRLENEEKKKGWVGWKPDREYVIAFAFDEKNNNNVLLIDNTAMEKVPGKHAGVIGALRLTDDKAAVAAKVLEKETGIVCEKPDYMGRLNFMMPDTNLRFHVFIAREFTGTIKDNPKKQPIWVPLKKLNYKLMSMDYPLWLPRMLRGITLEYYAKGNAEGKIYEDILDTEAQI